MFVAFIPFFTMLLPLKVEAVAPGERVAVLGWITFVGAVAASLANIGFGWLSDGTYERRRTRRPWIAAGLAAVIAGYALIHLARDVPALIAAIVFFQCALNMLFAPLGAVLADEVPDAGKGLAAALLSVGHPISSLTTVFVVHPVIGGEGARFAAVCALAAAMILPFLLLARERGLGNAASPAQAQPPPARDLALAWAARFAVQIAGTAIMTYLYFYFEGVLGARDAAATQSIARAIAWGTAASVVAALAGGRISDRIGRRKPFIALSGAGMAAGLTAMALADGWWQAAWGYGLFVAAYSMFIAVHSAFAVQLLPSPRHRGRDLGILNLTNTVPTVIGPLLAMWLLGEGGGFSALLLAVAAMAAAGAGAALLVRSRG